MARANKNIFSNENSTVQTSAKKAETAQNLLDKRSVEKLVSDIQERLKNPKEAKKATLIIQQWLEESPNKKINNG